MIEQILGISSLQSRLRIEGQLSLERPTNAKGNRSIIKPFLLASSLLGLSIPVYGAGFGIEQGVNNLASAGAGGSAIAEDATTVFSNPAGMARLKGTQVLFAANIIMPSINFEDGGSFINPAFTGGAAVPGSLTGNNGGDGGETVITPEIYITHEYNDKIHLGLGINVPFGLTSDYDDQWVGRYHGVRSELVNININPSLSYKLTPKLAMGMGLSAQYADLKSFSNAVDSGGVCIGALGAAGCIAAAGAAGIPVPMVADPATDSQVNLEGDDWGYGYNIGFLYMPSKVTRIGISYRSKIEFTIAGNADYSGPLVTLGIVSDTGAKFDLTVPESLSLSAFQDLSDSWSLMGDITWTKWEHVDTLVVKFENGAPDSVVPMNWDNTFRVSVGLSYKYNKKWTIRSGIAFDESAISHADDRSPRIPDSDRWWVATGFSYNFKDSLSFDLRYSHLFFKDARTNQTEPTTGHTLVGDFDVDVDIISGQLRWTFL